MEVPYHGGVGRDMPTWTLRLGGDDEEGDKVGAAEELGKKTMAWPCASALLIHYSAQDESAQARTRSVDRSERHGGARRAERAECFCVCEWFDASG